MTVTATEGLQEYQCQNSPAKQVSLHLNSNVATGLTITEIAKRQERFSFNERGIYSYNRSKCCLP